MPWKAISRLSVLAIVALLVFGQMKAQQAGSVPTGASANAPKTMGNIDVLSDTRGVDFGPYLSKQTQKIRANWYKYIPEEARSPQLKPGKITIEFAILKDGRVAGMRIVQASESVLMDRAAWGGVTASLPFDPLPGQFTGPYLKLRMHFFYNPQKLPPNEQPSPPSGNSPSEKPEPH